MRTLQVGDKHTTIICMFHVVCTYHNQGKDPEDQGRTVIFKPVGYRSIVHTLHVLRLPAQYYWHAHKLIYTCTSSSMSV